MFEVVKISAEDAKTILGFKEGHFLDCKRAEVKPAKMSETISAFANASGGEFYLGAGHQDDKSKDFVWMGFKDAEAANAHIQVIEGMGDLGNHYRARFLEADGYTGLVLHLVIPKTKAIIKATDGNIYVRKNAQNLRITGDDGLRRLELDKGIATFEDETVNISKDNVTNSLVVNTFALSVVPSAEPEDWLRSQFLLEKEKPTVAGVLLFSDEPQAALPKRSAIKLYRYKSKEEEGSRETLAFDPITIEGCIYDLIGKSVAETKKQIEGMKKLGVGGLEDVVYPDETLHEVVTNAVLHRDYSIASDIHVRIYDNRIEVESPGKLPGHVTTENILREQSARNPKLVRIINKFPDPPNKDVGEGLNTAFEAMKKLRLREPEIEEGENSVTVYIAHAPLASSEETVLEYLKTHEVITNSIARDLTGIRSENSMKEVFYRLNKRELIERVPGKKGNASAWRNYTGTGEGAEGDADSGDEAASGDFQPELFE